MAYEELQYFFNQNKTNKMKIRKLRIKLNDVCFLNQKYNELTKKAESWNMFLKFECSDFFNGKERAEYNRQIYYKEIEKIRRQINFIKKLIEYKKTNKKIIKKNNDIQKNDRHRSFYDKLKYYYICRKKGHVVSRFHPKYPSEYCSVCRKHRSEF